MCCPPAPVFSSSPAHLAPHRAAGRLMRCLFEVCMRRGWAGLTDKALMLSKCVMRRMWGSQTPLRQFKGIPYEILSKVGRVRLPAGAGLTPRWFAGGCQVGLPWLSGHVHVFVATPFSCPCAHAAPLLLG